MLVSIQLCIAHFCEVGVFDFWFGLGLRIRVPSWVRFPNWVRFLIVELGFGSRV